MKKLILMLCCMLCIILLSACSHKCIVDVCENKSKHSDSYCDEHIAFISETTSAMEELCNRYGLIDYQISFNYPEYSTIGYSINIDAKKDEIGFKELVSFIEEVSDYSIDGWWRTIGDTICINGHVYDYSKGILTQDGGAVYSTATPAPKMPADAHTCEVCNSRGEWRYESFTGQIEYYCYPHYKELQDMLNNFGLD